MRIKNLHVHLIAGAGYCNRPAARTHRRTASDISAGAVNTVKILEVHKLPGLDRIKNYSNSWPRSDGTPCR
jgi:hypothetical protein